MDERLTRRELLKKAGHYGIAAAGAGILFGRPDSVLGASSSQVAVATGGNIPGRLRAVLKACGGIERYVKKGSRVFIKPNIGWAREPEDAANTNPDLVFHLIRTCYAAGAKEVVIYENTCDNYLYCFKKSGIQDAVERAGGKLYAANSDAVFTEVDVPRARVMKKVKLVRYVQQADCFINVPIAKNHSAAKYTLSMKNMMGIVQDRQFWHMSGQLDTCIAEFMNLVKPQLTIIDAARILTTGGPKGPGKVEVPKTLIASTDFVAADSHAVTLFGKKGIDIPYIRMAMEMGLGQARSENIKVVRV